MMLSIAISVRIQGLDENRYLPVSRRKRLIGTAPVILGDSFHPTYTAGTIELYLSMGVFAQYLRNS
jgi:hypothetical protein